MKNRMRSTIRLLIIGCFIVVMIIFVVSKSNQIEVKLDKPIVILESDAIDKTGSKKSKLLFINKEGKLNKETLPGISYYDMGFDDGFIYTVGSNNVNKNKINDSSTLPIPTKCSSENNTIVNMDNIDYGSNTLGFYNNKPSFWSNYLLGSDSSISSFNYDDQCYSYENIYIVASKQYKESNISVGAPIDNYDVLSKNKLIIVNYNYPTKEISKIEYDLSKNIDQDCSYSNANDFVVNDEYIYITSTLSCNETTKLLMLKINRSNNSVTSKTHLISDDFNISKHSYIKNNNLYLISTSRILSFDIGDLNLVKEKDLPKEFIANGFSIDIGNDNIYFLSSVNNKDYDFYVMEYETEVIVKNTTIKNLNKVMKMSLMAFKVIE